MSGECDKCGDHALECTCGTGYRRRQSGSGNNDRDLEDGLNMKLMKCQKCEKEVERKSSKQKYCAACNGIVNREMDKKRRSKEDILKKN